MATNYQKMFEKDYQELVKKNNKLKDENKFLLLRATIAEDEQRRLDNIISKKETKEQELLLKIEEQNNTINNLRKEIERLNSINNNDGTNSGIPTSQTPINKKKVIPNFAKNTGEKIGRKFGHKKDKLEKLPDDKIDKFIEHTIKCCPSCKEKDLTRTGKIISKDVIDYKIITYITRHKYIEYKCNCCGKLVHQLIPNNLKEECQYGDTVKSLILTLTNVGNVPFNKTRRILSGLSMNDIEPCEGYLAKLQRTSSKKLDNFVEELRKELIKSNIVYWDDTVIQVNKKQSCIRYYGNDSICLFKAHEKKNKEGLDKDNILKLLPSKTVVEHDHNKVNYNSEYSFTNAECCQHLLRDLKKEINNFIWKLDDYLLKGLEENEANNKPYYSEKELTLIYRIMEYRDNYIYWILDFEIPFTNNLSERNLRGIKSKMKVSGQFQNIERAKDYANIRSYIETCRIYGKNEYDCLSRLTEGNPYTFTELISTKNK